MTNFIILSTLNGINDLSIPCESILSINSETHKEKCPSVLTNGWALSLIYLLCKKILGQISEISYIGIGTHTQCE